MVYAGVKLINVLANLFPSEFKENFVEMCSLKPILMFPSAVETFVSLLLFLEQKCKVKSKHNEGASTTWSLSVLIVGVRINLYLFVKRCFKRNKTL